MYKKIIHYTDKKHFGEECVIYKGEDKYLLFEFAGRDRGVYPYFVDLELKRRYPAFTYMKQINFVYDTNELKEEIDCVFDIDLERYGSGECPEWLRYLIQNGVPQPPPKRRWFPHRS